jgi:uncharacterized protein
MTFSRTMVRWAGRVMQAAPVWVTISLALLALIAYAGAVMGGLPVWLAGLLDGASSFSAVFLGIFIEAAPFLLMGTLASGIVEVFIAREDLARWIPRQPLLAVLAGSMAGMFFPVCECGVVPFARRLMQKGVPVPVGIAALLAVPVLNPIVIASTLAAFGLGPVFYARIGFSLLIAVLTALVFASRSNPRALLRDEVGEMQAVVVTGYSPAKPALRERMRQMLVVTADEFFEMGRFLVLGALLAALLQTVVRQSELAVVGQGPLLSVLALTGLAVLLSVCSTVDAFIALAFTGTFTTGAIIAFLVYGPMVDIKSTLMFTQVFKPHVVLALVLLPLLMTVAFTVLVNLLWAG